VREYTVTEQAEYDAVQESLETLHSEIEAQAGDGEPSGADMERLAEFEARIAGIEASRRAYGSAGNGTGGMCCLS